MSSDTQRRKLARDLQEKLEKTNKQTDEYEARYQTSTRTYHSMYKNCTPSIFSLPLIPFFHCDSFIPPPVCTRLRPTLHWPNVFSGTITQLKNGIHQIFTRIGAASASVDEMLGNQGVTETNMLQYLGIIEQRTSEILQQFAVTQMGAGSEHTLQLPSVVTAERGVVLSVLPPSYDEMSDGENSGGEEDERPLTRSELVRKTAKEYLGGKKGAMTLAP
jgi:hypothetical protein